MSLEPNPNIALLPPYPAAARLILRRPTPAVSVATTPRSDTRLVIETYWPPVRKPKPKIARSPPYPAAARRYLAEPIPAVSVATTPV